VIVAMIEAHKGFDIIADRIHTRDKRMLLIIITAVAFFLSAVLDNMTSVIIMAVLVRSLIPEKNERLIFVAMIVIAANAGGVWSPIGDVTTTMLWIHNKVSSLKLITGLFLPSLVSVIVPLVCFLPGLKGRLASGAAISHEEKFHGSRRVFALGVGALIFVPVLRWATGLPPYMGIILGMGLMWLFTDMIHKERHHLRVPHILAKIDISSVLFFLGILLAVAALESAGIFHAISARLDNLVGNTDLIIAILGVLSAVFDNVPLTAAIINMYNTPQYPLDSPLWHLTAYAVGTGGSLLIIGSAAGVVAMGMERISFGWYLKKATIPAFLGFAAGLALIFFT
ncbi:MAG: sodium:proton antiporter, partial [Candidatus Omnitrophica bacterium CG12_big_fil_rev_8_21_14_0_65_50_5]